MIIPYVAQASHNINESSDQLTSRFTTILQANSIPSSNHTRTSQTLPDDPVFTVFHMNEVKYISVKMVDTYQQDSRNTEHMGEKETLTSLPSSNMHATKTTTYYGIRQHSSLQSRNGTTATSEKPQKSNTTQFHRT